MRFEQITLEKYGAFSDRTLRFRDGAALHLIYGPNEAGKSTALQAVADLLFGFGKNSSAGFRFDNKTLRIGATLRLSDGRALSFRRRKGNANTIVDAQDKPLGDDFLDAVKGAITDKTFLSEFGLSAASLRAGGEALLSAQGNLAETLAAGSSGLSALNRLRQKIESEAADLYTSRKSASKKFYVALDQFTEARKRLDKAILTGAEMESARKMREEAAEAHRAATEAHAQSARALARLKRARTTMDKLRRLALLETDLATQASLPDVSADENRIWSGALQQAGEIERRIEASLTLIHDLAAKRQALRIEPDLLARAHEIEDLNREVGAIADKREDLPKRIEARRALEQELAHVARQFGLDRASLEDRLPTALLLGKARSLLQARGKIEDRITQARERLASARHARRELSAAQPDLVEDPSDLSQEFIGFAGVKDDAHALDRLTADIQSSTAALERDCARLDPPAGGLTAVIALPLPDAGAVAQAAAASKALAERSRAAAAARADLERRIRTTEAEIASLDRGGAVATPEDWRAVRAERDTLLARLRLAPYDEAIDLIGEVQAAMDRADQLAEALIRNADRAGQKQALLRDIDQAQRQLKESDAEALSLLDEAAVARAEWMSLWALSGVRPEAPERMAIWLKGVNDIIADHDRLAHRRTELAALEIKMTRARTALAGFIARLGLRAAPEATVEQLYDFAADALDQKKKAHNNARVQAERLRVVQSQIEKEEADLQSLLAELDAMQAPWREAMQQLSLSPDAGSNELALAIELWTRACSDCEKFHDIDHRVTSIERDIAKFESHVATLADRFGLAAETPERLVETLMQRLQAARRAADEDRRLEQDMAKAEDDRLKLQAEKGRVESVLAEAASRCATVPDQLNLALDALSARLEALAEAAALRKDLAIAGEGLSIDELRTEQDGLSPDDLSGAIELAEAEQARRFEAAMAAAVAESEAARAFETLCLGRDAAALAQEKAEACAELEDIARQWLLRAAAAKLALLAIEKHRQTTQDPVLAAISSLFATATGGVFTGLGLDYDDHDQPVFKAIRREGAERVDIAALSEGTRDQLFLALRLALLQQRHAEPLPFIGDDLLASFDDARTRHALEMLAQFGVGQQAILLTHHKYVVDLARSSLGDRLDLIELAA